MDSAKSLPSTPDVCKARANVPAKGPKPTDIKIRAAHTNSGIERKAFNSKRVSVLKRAGSALCVWLADKAKKIPKIAAIKVPRADMAIVSMDATKTFCKKDESKLGASNSPKKRLIKVQLRSENKRCSCKSSE